MTRTLNADLGESFGAYAFGHDEELLGVIDRANVACGAHAGDPAAMRRAVAGCVEHGVAIGAHPGLPDLVGFGRRRMALSPQEVGDLVLAQVGALAAFAGAAGTQLSHLKPHGALYAMLATDERAMEAVCAVAEQFGLTVLGLAGTAHEAACAARGIPFSPELYVDLDYRADGSLVVGERRPGCTPEEATRRVRAAAEDGRIDALGGTPIAVRFDSVCVHSDGTEPVAVARAVRHALDALAAA